MTGSDIFKTTTHWGHDRGRIWNMTCRHGHIQSDTLANSNTTGWFSALPSLPAVGRHTEWGSVGPWTDRWPPPARGWTRAASSAGTGSLTDCTAEKHFDPIYVSIILQRSQLSGHWLTQSTGEQNMLHVVRRGAVTCSGHCTSLWWPGQTKPSSLDKETQKQSTALQQTLRGRRCTAGSGTVAETTAASLAQLLSCCFCFSSPQITGNTTDVSH